MTSATVASVAVVWLYRIAIMLAPAGEVAVRYVMSHDPTSPLVTGRTLLERLRDPSESDEDLSAALSEANGYAVNVATYSGSFELRKLHMIWSAQDQATAVDDSRVCTFHFAKIAGGLPVDTWVAADFDVVRNALNTAWGSIKSLYPSSVVLDRMKFYKDGPAIDPPQVPVFDSDYNVAGTVAITAAMPPQVAISVTEKAGSKRHWGRFFLPAPAYTVLGNYGRLHSTTCDTIATAFDTAYESMRSSGIRPVVYRPALPIRQTAEEKRNGVTPGSLPARSAEAWDVEELQVDDVPDIIRSRRWKNPTLKVQRVVA